MTEKPDVRAGLARALAETHLELQGAEHDYRRMLNEGSDHMASRFPASALKDNPGALDHFSWHTQAMRSAQEAGGLEPTPELPYHPAEKL